MLRPSLLLSEIDPMQNNRVSLRRHNRADPDTLACVPLAELRTNHDRGYPCTVDYSPTYFLINGEQR